MYLPTLSCSLPLAALPTPFFPSRASSPLALFALTVLISAFNDLTCCPSLPYPSPALHALLASAFSLLALSSLALHSFPVGEGLP